jgi:hypothetical protein
MVAGRPLEFEPKAADSLGFGSNLKLIDEYDFNHVC